MVVVVEVEVEVAFVDDPAVDLVLLLVLYYLEVGVKVMRASYCLDCRVA